MKKPVLAMLITLSSIMSTSSAKADEVRFLNRCEDRSYRAAASEIFTRDPARQGLRLTQIRRGRNGYLFKIYGAVYVYDMVVRRGAFTATGDCNVLSVSGRLNRADESARRNEYPANPSSGGWPNYSPWYDQQNPVSAGYPS